VNIKITVFWDAVVFQDRYHENGRSTFFRNVGIRHIQVSNLRDRTEKRKYLDLNVEFSALNSKNFQVTAMLSQHHHPSESQWLATLA
jgi:hypothetical protein